ncbi:MAG TPA: MgtC/SapB family protein [Thermomicrobiales bacterium]|nr:MgtC/SapB family protein [Thermomicrobiales bacterium]
MSEWEAIVRLALAVALGGLIGLERETLKKDAGIRTHMLVTLGSAGFMVASVLMVGVANPDGQVGRGDITRIGSTIVTGIGFIAGGLIFRSESQVQGLTTAAGLWVTAAVGVLVGAGFYITAVGLTGLALFVLIVVRWGESRVEWTEGRSPRLRNPDTPDDG